MFKKLKDKIAEEVKQSPLKFQSSVQQLTQAVSSSSSANNLNHSETIERDEEKSEISDEITSNTEYDGSFITVDLTGSTPLKNRRSSSSSTINNELFPIYEFPPSRYTFQSDLESNSEFDDGSSIHQFTNVTKENLFEKYRTALEKYHKYRGRFVDMQKYYQELQREYSKAKNILTETQDKALRRIAELREQCNLEQKAKAHLEDVLRNEVEERDHVIETLKTKIDLLKSGKDSTQLDDEACAKSEDLKNPPESDQVHELNSSPEISSLKDKIQNFEQLLSKAKEALTRKNTQIQEMQTTISSNGNEMKTLNERIADLQNNIDLMRRKEEESLLSLAENKLIIHKELETKESHIKNMENKISSQEKEIKQLKAKVEEPNLNVDIISDTESNSNMKDDEIKRLQDELRLLRNHKMEETALQDKDRIIDEYKRTVEYSNQELLKLKNQIEASNFFKKSENTELKKLRAELDDSRNIIEKLNLALSNKEAEFGKLQIEKDSEISRLLKEQEFKSNTTAALEENISNLKSELLDKVSKVKSFSEQITVLNATIERINTLVLEKDELLKQRMDKTSHLEAELKATKDKLIESLEDKKTSEEREMNLKADKIVLEEELKNLRNELNFVKENLKSANVKLQSYETESTIYDKEKKEKQDLEDRFSDSEMKLQQLQTKLQRALNTEHELVAQNAKLIEEINNLKSKQKEYLNDIKNLKTNMTLVQNLNNELQNVDARFKETMQECEKCNEQNEILKKQNDLLKVEMETLQKNLNEFEKLNHEYEVVRTENETLREDREKLCTAMEELRECREEKEQLQNEINIINKSLQLLDEIKENYAKEIETLKAECEKFKLYATNDQHLEKENDSLRKNNEILLAENETVLTEKQKLMQELSDLKNEFEILTKGYLEIENNVKTNDTLNCVKEQIIKNLNDELSELKLTTEQLRIKNEEYKFSYDYIASFLHEVKSIVELRGNEFELEDNADQIVFEKDKIIHDLNCLKKKLEILTRESKMLNERIADMNMNIIKLSNLKNQAANLKNEYVKFKNHLKHDLHLFKQHYNNFKIQIVNETRTITQNFVREYADLESNYSDLKNQYEFLDNDNELLKNEKEELSVEVDNLSDKLKKANDGNQIMTHKNEMQQLKEKYIREIKEIAASYEARLAEKDNEYEELQSKLYVRNDRESINIQQETREIIRNLQEELTSKQDSYDVLLAEHQDQKKETENRIFELKEHYAKELRESDKKWRSCLDKKIEEIEEKYKEEINELTKEWTVDRKKNASASPNSSCVNSEFLEDSIKHSEDTEILKKQIQALSTELNTCKRSQWRDIDLELTDVSLEDCTEMEYLRNVLFKYMMGHQPLTLAKVLAAVVKFDNKQTKQILQREEQKQTLLGQFGLS